MPSQKPGTAFITYKHSVSVPYAKDLFSDTKIHGRYLQLAFRHGSMHADHQTRKDHSEYDNYNTGRYSSAETNRRSSHGSHYNSYQPNQSHHSKYSTQNQAQDPFTADLSILPTQGYRPSAHHREYDPLAPAPLFVSFTNPPTNFIGAVPLNQPGHAIDLETRRQRLLSQQRYSTQANSNRNQRRYENRYR